MRNVLLTFAIALLLMWPCASPGSSASGPDLHGLQLVTQLPAELPQRIKGFAYDGEKLWAVIYHGDGRYATLDPSTLQWKISDEIKQHQAIGKASGWLMSPGAACFANGKLWVAGSYGDSFGSIDTLDWKVEHQFKGKQREDRGSQSYSGIAFDGTHLWIAWHWTRYDLPVSATQLLLKVEPETGKVVAEYPLPPGTRPDAAHGLAWDGSQLWHAKDHRLSSIDPANGRVTAQYTLSGIKRPSGLAWVGRALWISEFEGKIWRLPF